MINITNKKNCNGCHACAEICPKQCITMGADEEGFLYPAINQNNCIDCNLCETVCPVINTPMNQSIPVSYAAYNKNEKIRMDSSSGGLFTLLGQYVIEQKGVVFGARFNDDFNVIHDYVEDIKSLSVFRGSKYVQSTIGNTYIHVENFLKQNRLVLFTGTPCQIGGLKSFLGKDYENLICQVLIAHNVTFHLKKHLSIL